MYMYVLCGLAENISFERYGINFACHDDRQLGSFLTDSAPMVLDMEPGA